MNQEPSAAAEPLKLPANVKLLGLASLLNDIVHQAMDHLGAATGPLLATLSPPSLAGPRT